jgi:hypothetical protein
MAMTTIAELDTEISRLQQEASAVERAPKSFDEVWPAVEAELAEAEATFRRLGPTLSGVISSLPEHVAERHRAMVGMALVANKKAVLDSERSRVGAATEGGMSATDRQRRLDQLRGAILQASAKRELLVRATEGDGEFQPRVIHPELAIYKQAAVERLAAR